MDNKVTIEKDSLIQTYKQASEEQKKMLINLFGEDMFKPLDIKERIKTFEDACDEIGVNDELYIQYMLFSKYAHLNQVNDVIAFIKLRIIVKALNEGWKPSFENKEHRHYPWFFIYRKNEYEALNDDDKKKCFIFAHPCGSSEKYVGIAFGNADYDSSYTHSNISYQLALKTKEIAEYCGKQFIDVWADYFFSSYK